jgi:hypothetical protein
MCVVCGDAHVPMERHHPIGVAYAPELWVDVCVRPARHDCHSALTRLQRDCRVVLDHDTGRSEAETIWAFVAGLAGILALRAYYRPTLGPVEADRALLLGTALGRTTDQVAALCAEPRLRPVRVPLTVLDHKRKLIQAPGGDVVRQAEAAVARVDVVAYQVARGQPRHHVHARVTHVVVVVPEQRRRLLVGIGDRLGAARREGVVVEVGVAVVRRRYARAVQMGHGPHFRMRRKLQIAAARSTRRLEDVQEIVGRQPILVIDAEPHARLCHDRRPEIRG